MYHVLVPVDTNPSRALTQASCVVDFPGPPDEVRATVAHARVPRNGKRRPVDEVDAVDRAVSVFEREGIPVDAVGCETPAGDAIVSLAEARDVDHIVMGSSNPSAAEELLLGSVTKSVFRHTEIPVTVTGPGVGSNLV